MSAALPQSISSVPNQHTVPRTYHRSTSHRDVGANNGEQHTTATAAIDRHSSLPGAASEFVKETYHKLKDNVTEMQNQIAALQAQVAAVQKQMALL